MNNTNPEAIKYIHAVQNDLADFRNHYIKMSDAVKQNLIHLIQNSTQHHSDDVTSHYSAAMKSMHSSLDKFAKFLISIDPSIDHNTENNNKYWLEMKVKKSTHKTISKFHNGFKNLYECRYLCDYVNYTKHEGNVKISPNMQVIMPKEAGSKLEEGGPGYRIYNLTFGVDAYIELKPKNYSEIRDYWINEPLEFQIDSFRAEGKKEHEKKSVGYSKDIYESLTKCYGGICCHIYKADNYRELFPEI